MDTNRIYTEAVEALNQLHLSRTGRTWSKTVSNASDQERIVFLKRRIYEEKIWPVFMEVLKGMLIRKNNRLHAADFENIPLSEIAEAIKVTAEICLAVPEGEALRRSFSEEEDGSAYYDINTNERLPYGDEDLLARIQEADRRFVLDRNSTLPASIGPKEAFIVGQTFDHEDDFWLRKDIRRGSENVFSFGVGKLLGRECLHIQRLTKRVVGAVHKRRKAIPPASAHFSSYSRLIETRIILSSFLWGKERLQKEIGDLLEFCPGCYEISYLTARRCAALLLHEESGSLKVKAQEEWGKFLKNHPNALGDTLLIQNALYFNAGLVSTDRGVQRMATYCGLHWVNL